MKFWTRWIGDYKKDTNRLNLAQIGAYDRLLDDYYAKEEPLPGTLDDCCRIAGAVGNDEINAVLTVLKLFFRKGRDGRYHHARVDEEIAKAHKRIRSAKENGGKGGRPRKKNPAGSEQLPLGETSPHPHPENYNNEKNNSLEVESGKAKRSTWLTPYVEAWESQFGKGSAASLMGQFAKALKPLHDEHGAEAVIGRLRTYLAVTEAKYASPTAFAQRFAGWGAGGSASRGGARAETDSAIHADLASGGGALKDSTDG